MKDTTTVELYVINHANTATRTAAIESKARVAVYKEVRILHIAIATLLADAEVKKLWFPAGNENTTIHMFSPRLKAI